MDARSAFAWILVGVLGVVTWLLVEPLLGWLLATGLLAFVLLPLHRRLEARIGSRPSAIVLTLGIVSLVVAPLVFGLVLLLTRGVELLEDVSRAAVVDRIERVIEGSTGLSISVQGYVELATDQLTSYLGDQAPAILNQSLHAMLGFLLLTFVLYYLLADSQQFVAWLERVTPLDPGVRDELFASVEHMTWAIVKGHVLVALVQGAVAGVALFLTGVPEAVILTIAMMVLALVPVVGVAPVLGGAIGYLFLTGQPLAAAFVFVWGMTTVAITDDYLRAVLIDRESTMHSAYIFVGILGGTYLLGAVGLFVGPIIVGTFKETVEVLGTHYGVGGRA